jgi:hypothetical protein
MNAKNRYLLLFIPLIIYLGLAILLDYTLIAVIIGIIAVVVTLLTVVFTFNIMARITKNSPFLKRDVQKAIDAELKNYKREEPIKKRDSLNKATTLDYFRMQLGKADDTLNFGYLFLGVGLIYLLGVLVFGQYVSLTFSSLTSNNPPLPTVLFLFVAEFFIIFPFIAYQKFIIIWKMGRVLTRYYGEADKNLADVIYKFFSPNNLLGKK